MGPIDPLPFPDSKSSIGSGWLCLCLLLHVGAMPNDQNRSSSPQGFHAIKCFALQRCRCSRHVAHGYRRSACCGQRGSHRLTCARCQFVMRHERQHLRIRVRNSTVLERLQLLARVHDGRQSQCATVSASHRGTSGLPIVAVTTQSIMHFASQLTGALCMGWRKRQAGNG